MVVVFISTLDTPIESLFFRYLNIAGVKECVFPVIAKNKNGKPYFVDSDICFSIAHKKRPYYIKLIAFSNNPVGVDIEFLSEKVNFLGLSKRFFLNDEKPQSTSEFLELFTKKEAYVKMLGSTLKDEIGKRTPYVSKNYDVIPDAVIAVACNDQDVCFASV